MKKLIILSIFALSFSTISPALAAEMSVFADVPTIEVTVSNVLPQSENVLNVLPTSQDVKPLIEATAASSVMEQTPVNEPDPLPTGTPPNHIPSPVRNIDLTNETITVTPPCATTCPNPTPVIVPVGEIKIIPCVENVEPALVDTTPASQADRIVLPVDPCPSITPVVEQTFSGSGGGSVIFPTNELPVNEPVSLETSIEVPGQKVLGEQTVVVEKTTAPSFPKTGAAPVAPNTTSTSTTPSNTSNALMSFSYSNDRKKEYSIA